MAFSYSQPTQVGAQSRVGEHRVSVRRKEAVGVRLDTDTPDDSTYQGWARNYPGAMDGGGCKIDGFPALDVEFTIGQGPVQKPSN